MEGFVDRWKRERATGSRGNLQETAGYSSDSSSSDDSIISVIPNVRPQNSFTSFNSPGQKHKTSLAAPTASSSHGRLSDANLEIVKSDLLQSLPQQIKQEVISPKVSSATPSTGPRFSNVDGKRTMSAAGRERQSQIMKERWAAGRMSHVHEKIRETKKRKASLEGLSDDEDERPPKRIASTANQSTLNSPALGPLPDADPSGYSRQQLELWQYIRTHLDVFKNKPIPKRCWVPDLLALPRVRDLKFNPRRSGKRPYVDTDDKKVAALLLYLTGKVALQPCSKCTNGKGAFDGCVKLSPNAFLGANIQNCANCWYSHQACSYETASNVDHTTANEQENHIVMGDDSVQEADSEVEDVSDISQRLPEKKTREPRPRPPAILHALSGRPYCKWPDELGNLVTNKGNVLLPDDYEIDADSQRPYTCPVGDCTRAPFTDLRGLGYHFPRTHYGQMLNDNCDGSFSVVGSYDNRKLGNGGSYPEGPPSFPYVVSQNPKRIQGVHPKRRAAAVPMPTKPHQLQDNDSDEEEVENQPVPSGGAHEPSRLMWEYIKPHLKKTTAIPDKGWVKELLPLPRVRDLRWNPERSSDFQETHPRDISCLIIQVTGEEAPKPCTKCARGNRPFAGCVVISSDAPPEVRARMVSCANCNYHNRQIDCSLIDWVVNRPQPPWPGYLGKGGAPVVRPSDATHSASGASPERQRVTDRRQPEVIPSSDRDSTASGHSASEPAARAQTSGPAGSRNVMEITRRQPPPPQRADSPAIPLGQPNAEQILEMQDWEIAPGHIRDQTSETQDNLAESKAYLTSGRSTQVSNDLDFRVEVISSGTKLSFTPMSDKIRSCSVGSGKLRVKIGDNPEFTIGPHGHFKIAAGVSAWTQNRLYIESVLHVHTATVYD